MKLPTEENRNDSSGQESRSVTCEPCSASARHEPYATEPARSQLGGNDNAASNERFERRGTVRAEVHQIIREISAATGSDVTVADVMGRSRFQYIVDVRHLAMVEVSKRFPWMSYPQMGRLFGGRDHSTIMHALRKFGALQKRMHGGGGGGVGVSARTYGPLIDFLFVRIGAALSVSAIPTEGATHETA